MRIWIANLWFSFRNGFWFIPANLMVIAFFLAVMMPVLDRRVGDTIVSQWSWLAINPAAARASLSAIAGATVTVAGIVFSITIVALSIASSQFGSRLVRTFMADVVTHLVLGLLVATSLYCLVVLRAVRDINGSPFAPQLSVHLGILAGVGCLGLLVFFIHHVAVSIQAPEVIAAVARELDNAIDRLFPERIGHGAAVRGEGQLVRSLDNVQVDSRRDIPASSEGYLKAVDAGQLLRIAQEYDLVIRLLVRPGDFVTRGSRLAEALPSKAIECDELAGRLHQAMVMGNRRTPRQDVLAAAEELVEIAVRALSPGINDPFTAMTCVRRLGATLCRLATRQAPSGLRYDENGQLRIIARPVTFGELLDASFAHIMNYGRSSARVLETLLETLQTIARQSVRTDDFAAIAQFAGQVDAAARANVADSVDRCRLTRAYDNLLALIDGRRARVGEVATRLSQAPSRHN